MPPTQPGVPDQTDHSATLRRLSAARARAVSAESAAILQARDAGLSWDVIGRLVDVNRDTLRKRYSRVTEQA